MPSHLSCSHTHTSRSSIPRSIIVRLPRLSPSRVSQRNPTLLLVTSLCSFCLEDKRYSHDRDGGETKNKSIFRSSSIQSPLRPDAEIGIKSHNNNSVRTTRLSASPRICFRVRFPPLCFSLDASPRVSFLSHSTCSRWRRVRFIRTTSISNMGCALSCCAIEHRSSVSRQVQVLI
jgi:hypothetical protein